MGLPRRVTRRAKVPEDEVGSASQGETRGPYTKGERSGGLSLAFDGRRSVYLGCQRCSEVSIALGLYEQAASTMILAAISRITR